MTRPGGIAASLVSGAAFVRRPWWTLLVSLALLVPAAIGLTRLRVDSSFEKLLDASDPAVRAMTHLLRDYRAIDDLLVMVSLPEPAATSANGPVEAEPDARPLLAFAERFDAALKADPAAGELVREVSWRAGPDAERFAREVLATRGLYYLDAAAFGALIDRLKPEAMREQLRRDEAMLASPSPAAGALSGVILRDPLRLHEFFGPAAAAMRPAHAGRGGSDAFLSADGRTLLIRVAGRRPSTDLDFAARLMPVATRAVAAALPGPLAVELTGGYAIADASHQLIRGDMIQGTIVSLIVMQLLFLLAYRSLGAFLIAVIPVGAGLLAGFGLMGCFSPAVAPICAGIAASLTGMAIDYALLRLSLFERRQLAGEAPREAATTSPGVVGDVLFACLTTLAAFVAILASPLPALRQFSLLSLLSLAAAFVATLTLLPALTVLLSPLRTRRAGLGVRVDFSPLFTAMARRPGRWLAGGVAALLGPTLLAAALCMPASLFDADASVMHPSPNPPLEAQRRLAQRFGADLGSLAVHVQVDQPEQLAGAAWAAREALSQPSVRGLGVEPAFGIAWLLPNPFVGERRLEITRIKVDQVVADFRAAVAESAFEPGQFEGYVDFLRQFLRPPGPPGPADLAGFTGLAGAVLPTSALGPQGVAPTQTVMLVSVDRPLSNREERARIVDAVRGALEKSPGATLTGMSVISHDTEAAVRRGLPGLLALAIVLIVGLLAIKYRRVGEAVVALLPTLVGAAMMLAAMALTEARLNLVSLAAAPLLIGVGVDYGIFVVGVVKRTAIEREEGLLDLAATGHAVTLCALTTLIGFGSLAFSHIPAVRSLGILLTAGVLGALLGTFLIVTPLVMLLRRRESAEPGPVG